MLHTRHVGVQTTAVWLPSAGSNIKGALGAGTFIQSSDTPVEVAGNHTFQAISAKGRHTCGVEPLPSARALCWG